MARLEVMERFLQDIGMEGGGLTLEAVMEVGPYVPFVWVWGLLIMGVGLSDSQIINICLVHVNKMVRDIAVRITLDLYKLVGCHGDYNGKWGRKEGVWRRGCGGGVCGGGVRLTLSPIVRCRTQSDASTGS